MNPEVLQKLREQDWNELGRRLVGHVRFRCGISAWKEAARDVALGLGKSAEDVVANVITKVFSGERTWDPERGELLPTLKAIVDSELDHLWKKHARRLERSDPEDVAERERQEFEVLEADPPDGPVEPEGILQRREEDIGTSAWVSEVFAFVEDKPELQAVVDAILDGCDPRPRFLAERLGVSVKEVNNRLRRLRRWAIE